MSKAFELVRRKLRAYEEQPEPWKVDHDDAMECYTVEDSVATGIFIFQRICRLDESVHETIIEDEVPKEDVADAATQLAELYRGWLTAFQPLLKMIKEAEDKDYVLQGSDEFRRICKEVQGVLTDDEKVFCGDRLEALERAAIEEFRAGKTHDLGSLTD